MTKQEKNNWLTNVENTATLITSEIGEEVVTSTLYKYGASSSEKMHCLIFLKLFSVSYM